MGVLGDIGPEKGAEVVAALGDRMARAEGRRAPPRLVVIGTVTPAVALPRAVRVHGPYEMDGLAELAARYRIGAWLVPSIWPETFCFTAHEALATGLPTYAFDLGAQGRAVRNAPNGRPVPYDAEAAAGGRAGWRGSAAVEALLAALEA